MVSESDAHQFLSSAAVLLASGRSHDPDKRHASLSRGKSRTDFQVLNALLFKYDFSVS